MAAGSSVGGGGLNSVHGGQECNKSNQFGGAAEARRLDLVEGVGCSARSVDPARDEVGGDAHRDSKPGAQQKTQDQVEIPWSEELDAEFEANQSRFARRGAIVNFVGKAPPIPDLMTWFRTAISPASYTISAAQALGGGKFLVEVSDESFLEDFLGKSPLAAQRHTAVLSPFHEQFLEEGKWKPVWVILHDFVPQLRSKKILMSIARGLGIPVESMVVDSGIGAPKFCITGNPEA